MRGRVVRVGEPEERIPVRIQQIDLLGGRGRIGVRTGDSVIAGSTWPKGTANGTTA
jgi:hypothetical protein